MHMSQLNYLPLHPAFFSILVGLFVVLFLLLQLGALRYAFMRIGLSSGAALALLVGSLIGSYFNIPIAELPEQQVLSGQDLYYYGMRYAVPLVVEWPSADVDVLSEDCGYTAVHGSVVKIEDGDAFLARRGSGLRHCRRNPGRGY